MRQKQAALRMRCNEGRTMMGILFIYKYGGAANSLFTCTMFLLLQLRQYQQMASLFQRLGGEGAISSVVDKFYEFMLKDPVVNYFFANTDMNSQKLKQKQFITLVTGGPNNYQGLDMKKAHQKMKIAKKEFDATWMHLCDSLQFHGVSQGLINQVKEIFYSVQEDVVNVKEDTRTLFLKLGGEQAISAVVDKFYQFMLADPVVSPFFKNTDMQKQRKRQKQFITLVTGGPNHYEGVDMKKAHHKLGIGKKEFDQTWNNLQKALLFFEVKATYINELKQVFYSVQNDVIQKKTQQREPLSTENKQFSKTALLGSNIKEFNNYVGQAVPKQKKQQQTKSLFDRLGGEGAINAVVDKFYEFMLKDPIVSPFFQNTDMQKQRKRQKQFITLVTGGPNNYDGLDMKKAHAKFKIGKKEFNQTWNNLEKALLFFEVGQSERLQLKDIFYSVQADVQTI